MAKENNLIYSHALNTSCVYAYALMYKRTCPEAIKIVNNDKTKLRKYCNLFRRSTLRVHQLQIAAVETKNLQAVLSYELI